MHIVHLEDFVHPDAGYQLNMLAPLQKAEGHRITIVTGELDKVPAELMAFFGKSDTEERDRAFEQRTGVAIVRVPLLGFYSGRAIFSPQLFGVVSRLKPDALFVHGEDTLTGIVYIRLAPWLSYPLVLDCHMVEMASHNRFREQFRSFYRRFITPVILRENIPLIRVVDSDFVEKCLGIPLSHTELLSFGSDTTHFRPDDGIRRKVRARLGIADETFLVLYAGKLDHNKGGKLLGETIAGRLHGNQGRPIEFLIIGNSEGDYGKEVEVLLTRSENKIIRLPTQRFFDLAQYYQAADLALFPRQCSLSFFDVQSCGVPILFERNEINCQRGDHGGTFYFEPGDVGDFRAKISELANTDRAVWEGVRQKSRKFILDRYDYAAVARQFTEVIVRARDQWLERKAHRK